MTTYLYNDIIRLLLEVIILSKIRFKDVWIGDLFKYKNQLCRKHTHETGEYHECQEKDGCPEEINPPKRIKNKGIYVKKI